MLSILVTDFKQFLCNNFQVGDIDDNFPFNRPFSPADLQETNMFTGKSYDKANK